MDTKVVVSVFVDNQYATFLVCYFRTLLTAQDTQDTLRYFSWAFFFRVVFSSCSKRGEDSKRPVGLLNGPTVQKTLTFALWQKKFICEQCLKKILFSVNPNPNYNVSFLEGYLSLCSIVQQKIRETKQLVKRVYLVQKWAWRLRSGSFYVNALS